MAVSPSPTLAGFVSIGTRTSLYVPPHPVPGQLIIICTWLGAAKKHIAKYTSLHQLVAPGARILLVESNVWILVSSYARQRRHIQSAASTVIDTLSECGYYERRTHGDHCNIEKKELLADRRHLLQPSRSKSNPPKIIIHSFSNGGTNTTTQLLIEVRHVLQSPLPLCGILLDSSPAKGTYWKSYTAMILSLPRGTINKILGSFVVHFLLTLLYTWIACGNENPASLMRRTLLDEKISKGEAERQKERGRICYLYSKEDKMTEWTDVKEHADEARRKGWSVDEEIFKGTAHCQHFISDVERYTRAITNIWRDEA